ncbi:GbsR/MarR family transcriptional regulator [Oceanobacillus manasiensis]|uniref:GbsR/MarR family transcriptional regulator n=1 Tax=Oceanobacillus manasiensis TaxID=586413 RepID=UPI0005AB07B6|nr:transcriptional regulator [Oceanobacillus manasiensis]
MKLPQNENVTNEIMIEFSKTLEMFDLTPLEARLFAYLYLYEKPFTLDEMSEVLGKSKTSMSTGVRTLSDLNLVTRVWKKGVRKDLYQANTQLFKTFMNFYINKWIDATIHQKDSLEETNKSVKQNLSQNNTPELEKLSSKLQDIITFHTKVEHLFRQMKQD